MGTTKSTDEAVTEPYGATKLGYLIHGERIKHGFKSPQAFCDEVKRVTGYDLRIDTLQRIECGRQEAKVSQYASIAKTLGMLEDALLVESFARELG